MTNAITVIGTNLVVDFEDHGRAVAAMDWLDSHKPVTGRFIDDDGAAWPTRECAICKPQDAWPCAVVRWGGDR